MIAKKMQKVLSGSSVIRAMFVEGQKLAKQVGAENVYDFSLGNPAAPAPDTVAVAIRETVDTVNPLTLHGYMPNAGYPDVRAAIADSLNSRFHTDFNFHNIVMTVGAAGGLNIVFKTLLDPGDEVVVFAPYFGEYRSYTDNFDGVLVEVAPEPATFQPDLADFESKLTKKTKIVVVNTPNNPTGVVYSDETLLEIGGILSKKEAEFGREIYLVSDEPYRELVYDGQPCKFLTGFYHNTIAAYSFSKSLSLPGERIGYVVVPVRVSDADTVLAGLETANRTLGFVNAPSLMQKVIVRCLDEKTDVAFYDGNRKALYEGLTKLGFTCLKPQGAFYLWMKSPDRDDEHFIQNAKKFNLILVKGSAFGWAGYVRIAYCVSPATIRKALPAFEKLAQLYDL